MRAWTWSTLGALGALWGSALIVMSRGITSGQLYWEGDTASYYLPVLQTYQAALRHADLPLWSPFIFAGHPLFAEGEGGMLYPLNVVLTALLPLAQAYTWQLVMRFGLSGTFAFWLARVLGLGHLPALMGGLVFAFSSFMVGQMHHSNVADSAVWLPAVLASAECAARSRARFRLGWILVGGVGLGCAMLAVHVEPVLMIGLLVGIWCLVRAATVLVRGDPLWPTVRSLDRRLQAAVGIVLIAPLIGVVGLGLGAAQLLPLVELAQVAARGEGLSYASARDFALAPVDLVTVLFPYVFQGPDNRWWSLWFQWETTLYIGIAPLVLAAIAIVSVRTRETWLFAGVALAGLLLALGDNSPVNLFWLLWHVPGLAFLRAPGRFSLLVVLSGAMLTAFGFQWLATLQRPTLRMPVIGLALLALDAGAVVVAGLTRAWLEADTQFVQALEFARDWYLTLPHDQANPIDPALVVRGVLLDVDLSHAPTVIALVLVASTAGVFISWSVMRRWQAFRLGALSSLVALDLLMFATTFHQVAPADALTRPTPAASFLANQIGDYRVVSSTSSPSGVEPDRLLAVRVPDAGGYSSLSLERVEQYLKRMGSSRGTLLDLMHVRYVLNARRNGAYQTYSGVSYDRLHPRVLANRAGAQNSASFAVGGSHAMEVRLIGFLLNDRHVDQGTEIGRVTVDDASGSAHVAPLRAGVEIADQGIELPLATPAAHLPAQIAFSESVRTAEGAESRTLAYLASLTLDNQVIANDVRLDFTYPDGELDVLGLALVDATGAVQQVTDVTPFQTQPEPAGRQVYADDMVQITENGSVMDRAFLVYSVAPAPSGPATLDLMSDPLFDPRRQVVLDGVVPDDVTGPPPTASSVTIVDQSERHTVLRAQTASPAVLVLANTYYPGWRATVDGTQTAIVPADYIFQAIHVPGGDHTIEFSYEPATFKLGALVSAATLLVVLGLALGLWLAARRRSTGLDGLPPPA